MSQDYLLVQPSRFTPAFYFEQFREALLRVAASPPGINTSYAGLRLITLPDNPTWEQWVNKTVNMDVSAFIACGLASPGTIIRDFRDREGNLHEDGEFDFRYEGITCAGAPGFYYDAIPLAEELEDIRREKKVLEKLVIDDE